MVEAKYKKFTLISMIVGIISIVLVLFGMIGSGIGIACGIVGIVFATIAKNHGVIGGKRTAGFVCSIIGLCIDAVYFLYCCYLLIILGTIATAFGA